VVVIGDSEVGKSSLVQRYLHDRYYNHGRSTIGVDLERRTIQVNGKSVRIQLWCAASRTYAAVCASDG
jgi:GTPase SAR1 family protein